MLQKLAKKWGPHAKGTRVTTDPAEADKAHRNHRAQVVLVSATRLAWLEEQGYFRAATSAEDPDGEGGGDLLTEDPAPAPLEQEEPEPVAVEAEADTEPETPPATQGLAPLTEPQEVDDDGR